MNVLTWFTFFKLPYVHASKLSLFILPELSNNTNINVGDWPSAWCILAETFFADLASYRVSTKSGIAKSNKESVRQFVVQAIGGVGITTRHYKYLPKLWLIALLC